MDYQPGREDIKRNLIIFGSLHALIFLGIFAPIAQFFYHGTGKFGLFMARKILDGKIPYHDFTSEYPPLALLGFLLPGLFSSTALAYSWGFAVELLLCDLLIIFFITDLASFMKISVRNSLGIYTLFIIATGAIVVCRYDILPAMLVLAALWAFVRGRTGLAWAAAALGITAKMYPALIVPLFVIYQVKNGQYHQLIKGGAIFLAILAVVIVPWLIIDAPGFWNSMSYHLERELHAESTYGTALMAGQLAGMSGVSTGLSYGSWNIISPLGVRLADISFFVTAGVLIIVYGLFVQRLKKTSAGTAASMTPEQSIGILRYSALAISAFMLTSKIFSAQFLIWLCPLLPFIAGERKYITAILYITAAAFTQYVYPYNYVSFTAGEPWPVAILAVRNLVMVVMAILIALPHHTAEASYQSHGTSALRPGG
jgi:uncharacterized membrane protein